MITGLRLNGKSVQENLNLKPSISTLESVGGGLPIGIIGIKRV